MRGRTRFVMPRRTDDTSDSLLLSTSLYGLWRMESASQPSSYLDGSLVRFDEFNDFKWRTFPQTGWLRGLMSSACGLAVAGTWSIRDSTLTMSFRDFPNAFVFIKGGMAVCLGVLTIIFGGARYQVNLISESELELTPLHWTTNHSVLKLHRLP
jgi:hypothetical protein